jgi:hypothetical protein
MPASPAQIRANQANAAHSTGPKTPEGKEKSRQNAVKHGLTGAGVVVPPDDAVEVDRRFKAFREELQPAGMLGLTLVRRAALLAVRMEKCSEIEMAATKQRVARALEEFEAPEGADPSEIARLQADVAREAAFDPSKEACLLRRYESAAERGFFRALKELRFVEKPQEAIDPDIQAEIFRQELGSFLEMSQLDEEMAAEYPELALPVTKSEYEAALGRAQSSPIDRVDVPLTIGRAR